LILLVTHQGSFGGALGSHGGFAKNSEGQFIRNEGTSENLAKGWLSRNTIIGSGESVEFAAEPITTAKVNKYI
jgi:hypothetical protein